MVGGTGPGKWKGEFYSWYVVCLHAKVFNGISSQPERKHLVPDLVPSSLCAFSLQSGVLLFLASRRLQEGRRRKLSWQHTSTTPIMRFLDWASTTGLLSSGQATSRLRPLARTPLKRAVMTVPDYTLAARGLLTMTGFMEPAAAKGRSVCQLARIKPR